MVVSLRHRPDHTELVEWPLHKTEVIGAEEESE